MPAPLGQHGVALGAAVRLAPLPSASTASMGLAPVGRHSVALGATVGLAAGIALGILIAMEWARRRLPLVLAWASTQNLPKHIILVRHGESEGNADLTLYRSKPDNLIEVTGLGSKQAVAVGARVRGIIGDAPVHIFVSPFQRTLQTARSIGLALGKKQVVRTSVDPRIREQEFGNLQDLAHVELRQTQQLVGRFWFRFPTGESGADVYDRVRQWWESAVLRVNQLPRSRHCEVVLVVTHGLTMRLILMQLYGWSPTTFHSVWNAANCDMYVLTRRPGLRGHSPYILNRELGDTPLSSIELLVTMADGEQRMLVLQNYLSVPSPRTLQYDVVKEMLARQHCLDPSEIVRIDFEAGRFGKFR